MSRRWVVQRLLSRQSAGAEDRQRRAGEGSMACIVSRADPSVDGLASAWYRGLISSASSWRKLR